MNKMDVHGDKPPSICHLPDRVLRQIAALIDTSVLCNWRTLATLIPEYTQMDVRAFAIEEQRGRSASMALLHDLHSRGWTVVDLASLARRAQMAVIVDKIKQHCQEAGIRVEFAENSDQNKEWKSAKTCFDRPPYPPSSPPPSPPPPSPPPPSSLPLSHPSPSHPSPSCPFPSPLPPTPPAPSHSPSSSWPSSSPSLPPPPSHSPSSSWLSSSPSLPPPSSHSPSSSQPSSSSSLLPSQSPSTPPHPSHSAPFPPPSQQHSTAAPSSLPPPTHPQGPAEVPSTPPHPSHSAPFPPPSHQHSTAAPSSLPPPTHPQGPAEVPYSYLKEVTNGFSQTPFKEGGHKLGEGGFGKVFYCWSVVHGMGMETAVKVLNSMEGSASCSVDKKQFLTELRALSLLSHECLLPILGYSCDGPHLCLLYPFMSNGSLDTHLPSPVSLPSHARLQVAWDVTRALEYLHTGNTQVCVHRDVKSANILLTEKWRGRLGDFGVVRFLPSPLTIHTTTVVGTLVYMAPEYSTGGLVSPAADVYAFGVVLYELLTGKSAQNDIDEDGTDLISYVEEFEGEVSDILIGQWLEEVGQGAWILAERCIEENRARRPTASELCVELQSLHAAAVHQT